MHRSEILARQRLIDSAEDPSTEPGRAASRHRYLWRYEGRRHPPLPLRRFLLRLVAHAVVVAVIATLSVTLGLAGFMHYEHLAWRDALLETTMLLGGMGPTAVPRTSDGKLFASFFALYAGIVFIVTAAILVSPAIHRVLHLFHSDPGP